MMKIAGCPVCVHYVYVNKPLQTTSSDRVHIEFSKIFAKVQLHFRHSSAGVHRVQQEFCSSSVIVPLQFSKTSATDQQNFSQNSSLTFDTDQQDPKQVSRSS